MYAFGICSYNSEFKYNKDIFRYDVDTNTWSVVGETPDTFKSCYGFGDKVYYVGDAAYEYSFDTDSWVRKSDPAARPAFDYLSFLAKVGNELYFLRSHRNSSSYFLHNTLEKTSLDSSDNRLRILLQQGEAVQLKGMLLPSGVVTEDVLWAAADTAIVSVDDTGLALGVSPGTTLVTVTAKDDSWSDSVLIKVVEGDGEIAHRLCIQLREGENCQLIASDDDAMVFDWNSSDPSIATVSNTGRVTAVSAGLCLITVKSQYSDFEDNIYVKVIPQ